MLLPRDAVGARLVRRALADHAEAVSVVDVEDRVVAAGEPGELGQVGSVSGHAVDPVHADRAACVERSCRSSRSRSSGSSKRNRFTVAPRARRELAAVVDRLVGSAVDEDRPVAGEHRDHGQVDQRDRRDDERVLAAEQLDQTLFDLLVEDWAAEHARPARMRSPLLEVLGDDPDDLAVEVEAEVVARGEIGQPLVADPDHPAVDLVDDGVRHRVGSLELGQLTASGKPAIDPPRGRGRGPGAIRTVAAHAGPHRHLPRNL